MFGPEVCCQSLKLKFEGRVQVVLALKVKHKYKVKVLRKSLHLIFEIKVWQYNV